MNRYQPLLSDQYYHVVQRAVGNELIFREPENYRFFLQRYKKYISPLADTFAYCLLPNHFHFIVQVKRQEELLPQFLKVKPGNTGYDGWQPGFVMQQWSNLLNSYTKSFNKRYNRMGSLFMDYTRRVFIEQEAQLSATVFYVHKNAVHHGFCNHIEEWPWSSYNAFLSNAPSLLMRDELLAWFGNRKQFIEFHQQPIYLKNAVVAE